MSQGIMFGFATNETPELLPAPIVFAHKLLIELARRRKRGHVDWLRPDCKSQVLWPMTKTASRAY